MIQKTKIPADIVLLISRLIIGGIFVYSAYLKFGDLTFFVESFKELTLLGIALPAFLAYIVAGAEMLFGIFLIIGVCMSLSTLVLAIIMAFATYFTLPLGFQMYAVPLVMFAGLLALHAAGAGRIAVPVPDQCK